MSIRSGSRRTLLAALLLPLAVAACEDESPLLSGDENFPGGSRPTTLELVVPAAGFFTGLGSFTDYVTPRDVDDNFRLVANQYGGALNANTLLRFERAPAQISYVQGGQSRSDTLYTFGSGRLVVRLDTIGSAAAPGPITLQLHRLAQTYDPETVTWSLAVDTTGGQTAWTTPGGTRGALLGQGSGTLAADSIVLTLDSLAVRSLADTASFGVVLSSATAGSRLRVLDVVLRTGVYPDAATPDTLVALELDPTSESTFIFSPEPPTPAGLIQVGGVRGARTLVRLDLDQQVPTCVGGPPACGTVPLSQVTLNRVSLLLRPVPTPGGFAPIDSVLVTARTVQEPELGGRAPLGVNVADQSIVGFGGAYFSSRDTLLELGFTGLATAVARGDTTLPRTLALLAETANFGVAFFEPTPRLRIVYTLPVRPELP